MSKKCPDCNASIPDEASFCMNCFTKISPMQPENIIENNKNKKIFLLPIIIVVLIIISTAIAFTIHKQNINNAKPDTKEITSSQITTETKITTTEKITYKTTSEKPTTKPVTTTTTAPQTTEEKTTVTTTKKETTQPSGSIKYSSYGNGIIITSYSGNESNIIIPDKIDGKVVLAVGENAFGNNKYIKTITFEEGSSTKSVNIKSNAFNNLSSLTKLKLPSQIEADNFTNCISKCNNLQGVTISKKYSNSGYYSANGIVYGSNNSLVLYPAGKTSASYSVPYKVTAINKNSFKGNSYLKKIKFSKREELDVSWSNLFSRGNIKNLETIEIYAGTDADIIGIQYFDGEILYYD